MNQTREPYQWKCQHPCSNCTRSAISLFARVICIRTAPYDRVRKVADATDNARMTLSRSCVRVALEEGAALAQQSLSLVHIPTHGLHGAIVLHHHEYLCVRLRRVYQNAERSGAKTQ